MLLITLTLDTYNIIIPLLHDETSKKNKSFTYDKGHSKSLRHIASVAPPSDDIKMSSWSRAIMLLYLSTQKFNLFKCIN